MTIEEDDSSTELLLDPIVPSELQDDDDGVTLDEDFAELLLDSSLALRMTDEELLDPTSFELLLDFSDFSLELDEGLDPSLLLRACPELDEPCSIEEDDSTPGSSFGPVEDEESSPQAANNIAAAPIATRNFLIKPPANRYNKNLFVRRNRAILIWSFFHQSAEIIILEAKKRYI